MTSAKKAYAELLSLTQLFILREHALKEMKVVSPEVWSFFQKKTKTVPAPPVSLPPKKTPLPPRAPINSSLPVKPPLSPPPVAPREEPSTSLPIEKKLTHPNTSPETKKWNLELLTKPQSSYEEREFWKSFPVVFPGLKLYESVPSDDCAQRVKNAWSTNKEIPPILILSFRDEEKPLTLLKNLAHAISLRFALARVFSASQLEKERGWENVLKSPGLQLVIASDYDFYLQAGLKSFYREVPQQGKHFLQHIPLLLLSDLSLYLKEPSLKAFLWRAICNEFKTLKLSSSAF